MTPPTPAPARPEAAEPDFFAHRDGDASQGHRVLARPSRALGWSFALVVTFGAVEAVVGWLSNSLALLSDAVHMSTDAVALGLAWFAQRVAGWSPSRSHSFGYERAEPLAAFVNALFYLVLLGAIAVEAVGRLVHPVPIRADWAMPVAVLGLVVNAVMLWLLRGDGNRLNTRAALLHVIGDFAGSVIAIVAIGTAWLTGWTRVDPLLSLLLSLVMLVSTLRLLRTSSRVLMNAVPEAVDIEAAVRALRGVSGIVAVHDLHLWSLGGGTSALSAHLELERLDRWPQVLAEIRHAMREGFGIEHLTLQPEAARTAPPAGGAAETGAGGVAGPAVSSPPGAATGAVTVAPGPGGSETPTRRTEAELARRLARVEADRDAALRHALEAEQQRDLNAELALRFERELEDERRALAHGLSDEIGQHAVALRSMAATFEQRLSGREPSLAQLATLMVRNTDALTATIRGMIQRVRPEALERGGLLDGLRALVADWRLRRPEMRFELLLEPADDLAFGLGAPALEEAAWRIAAEAIENAVAHAGARTVIVSARREDDCLTLQVSDDGRGLPARDGREGPGLRAMRERAAACGGSVAVATGEAGGVEVLVRLPWPGPTL